jgi:ParB-like chromosome segregation protein Spo0J
MTLEVVNIPIERLVKDPKNLREDGDVGALVEEIKNVGFTNPIEVRPLRNGVYGVVAGSRRLKAAKQLGLQEVPCIIREMDDAEALRRSMADNELQMPLSLSEKAAYYAEAIRIAGGLRAAARMFGFPKETMRETLEMQRMYELLKDEEEGAGATSGQQPDVMKAPQQELKPEKKEVGKGKKKGEKKLRKKDIAKAVKEELKKRGYEKGFWKPDVKFSEEVRKAVQERLQNIQSKLWEPKVFKRKPEAPTLHEMLQKPTIFEVTPTDRWPIGWKPVSTKGQVKSLFPVYQLKGDFSSITVLLCPECGSVLRGLGKGIPVVCLDCGFPSNENGWKQVDGGS